MLSAGPGLARVCRVRNVSGWVTGLRGRSGAQATGKHVGIGQASVRGGTYPPWQFVDPFDVGNQLVQRRLELWVILGGDISLGISPLDRAVDDVVLHGDDA